MQVNAFFKRCNSRSSALCNCGVAVRSGDSLFVTNFCETELTNGERRTNNYIIQRLCDDQNLIIEETGDKFKVTVVFFKIHIIVIKYPVRCIVCQNIFSLR